MLSDKDIGIYPIDQKLIDKTISDKRYVPESYQQQKSLEARHQQFEYKSKGGKRKTTKKRSRRRKQKRTIKRNSRRR